MTLDIEQSGVDEIAHRVMDWVRPDEGRVRHSVYADPTIFAAEIERIWKRTWLWAGHESEVPAPGDFVSRTVGTVPIIISRTSTGSIAVNLNVCVHRGNRICHLEHGNTRVFKCAYHGWAYDSAGTLVGVPYPKAYSEGSPVGKLRLPSPAKVANYRGLIFVSYCENVPSIEDFLGTIRPELDRIFDLSPVGKLRFDVGCNRLKLDCNWKVFQENSSGDNYHTNFTHIAAFTTEAQRRAAALSSSDSSIAEVRGHSNGHAQINFWEQEKAMGLVIRTGNAGAPQADEQRYLGDLVAAVGEERARRAFEGSPPLLYIYPSLLLIYSDLRRVEPVGPGQSLLFQHPYMLEGVPDSINTQRLSRHEAAYGPAGFVVTDDMEVWARIQRNMTQIPDRWTDLTRGIHRERFTDDGVVYSQVTDETSIRGAWRQYRKLMTSPPFVHCHQ